VTGVGNFAFSGLAAGASETRTYSVACEAVHEATADSHSQVDESDETNNVATFTAIC
jgi:subtilase family serine protease